MTRLPLLGLLAMASLALPALSYASTGKPTPVPNCSPPTLTELGKHFRSALTDDRLTDARSILQTVVYCKRHDIVEVRN